MNYVQNSHLAIISSELYDIVQNEMKRRDKVPASYREAGILSSKIICRECSGFYGRKIWNSNNKCQRVVYQCNNKYKCKTPHVKEEIIKQLFVEEINKVIEIRMG